MKGRKLSFTTRYVLTIGVLLFVANLVLGAVILGQTKTAMKEIINKNMLDVVKSAAGSLDGDVLGALTEEDAGCPVFRDIEDRLLVFQNSVDIQFIYAVKQADDGRFVFTVDPDPVDPGAFGEEVLTTPALVAAAKGVPTVDSSPAADRWGNFYSAFSPVFDSSGKVAGVVGVDFDAEWYDEQIARYSWSIAFVASITVLAGVIVVGLITNRVRMRFRDLDAELSDLSHDIDLLMSEMAMYSGFEAPVMQSAGTTVTRIADESDELEKLSGKICIMQNEMGTYLEYLRTQAYTDALTRVGNSTAYHEAVDELEGKIAQGAADFWVAVFDLNSLKEINDTYGHEFGNVYIQRSAQAVSEGLEDARVFRIGGDEFAVIAEGYSQARMDEGLKSIAASIRAFNETEKPCPANLALSKGASCYVAGQDTSYKQVFTRADQAMYDDKREYYRTIGDRRRRRD